jgi:hypothetical protein
MISRPMPRSAPNEFTDDDADQRERYRRRQRSKQPSHGRGITTARIICHSPAPSNRAALIQPSSMERAPSKVLKNTRNTTTIPDVTIFDVSPIPNANTMVGAKTMRGIEFTVVMKGWKMSLRRRHHYPRHSQASKNRGDIADCVNCLLSTANLNPAGVNPAGFG